jgi:phosphate/sulfate permease
VGAAGGQVAVAAAQRDALRTHSVKVEELLVDKWRQKIASLRGFPRFLFLAAVGTLTMALIFTLVSADNLEEVWVRLAAAPVAGLLMASMMFGMERWRRRHPRPAMEAAVDKAIKDGVLPPDADRATWRPVLQKRLRSSKVGLWVGPLEFAAFSGLCVWLILAGGGEEPAWRPWFYLTVFVAIGIGLTIYCQRQVKRIGKLIADLGSEEMGRQRARE